jgi:glyoxylase-like metal-dependent hydrolase (beta-lactamase superfamily II)
MNTIFKLALPALLGTAFAAAQANPDAAQLSMYPVQGNVYMLAGAGGNITVQVGKEGVLLVDSGLAPMAAKVMAELRKLTNAPVFYIVNTHVHPDHVGGNEAFAKSGAGGDVSSNGRVEGDQPLRIIAH